MPPDTAAGGFDWNALLQSGLGQYIDNGFAASQLPGAGVRPVGLNAQGQPYSRAAAPLTTAALMPYIIAAVVVLGGVLIFVARKG